MSHPRPRAKARSSHGGRLLTPLLLTLAIAHMHSLVQGENFGESPLFLRLSGGQSIDPASNFLEIRRDSAWDGGSMKDLTYIRQARLVAQPFDSEVELVQTNGTADYEHTYTFRPEKGKVITDYSLVPVSSNGDVLTSEDVGISIVDIGNGNYNVTTLFEFDRASGMTDFDLNFVDIETGVTLVGTSTAFVVAGISFFHTNSNGTRVQIGGEKGNLILSASDIIEDDTIWVETFIQYLDGTNSTEAMAVGMNGMEISFSGGAGKYIAYDQNSCAPDGGTFDGSEVSMVAGCGVAFSTNAVNGEYVGPQLGLDFETNRNGSFVIAFDWEDLVVGSDAEIGSAGYETYIGVDIVGEVAPIISSISPPGPFATSGGDSVTLVVDNLPANADVSGAWQYNLSITFGEGDAREATLISTSLDVGTGETTLVYSLPPGSGTNLPWDFTTTKPTGETLTGVDGTSNGAYRFSFEDRVPVITTMSPDSGSPLGGTSVTVTGSFIDFDINEPDSYISIGTTTIDKSLITSVSETSIVFTTPPESSVAGGADGAYGVTITANGNTSEAATFRYTAITISAISPGSGSISGNTTVTLSGNFGNFDPATSGSTITVGGQQIPSEDIISFSPTQIVFTTPAQTSLDSTNSVFRFPVVVTVGEESSNPEEFVYEAPVLLNSLSPASGVEEGGSVITLTGQFVNFNPATSGVYLGGKQIDDSLISSYTDSEIVFTSPARGDIGSSYTYPVSVVIGDLTSNAIEFTYEARGYSVNIDGSGSNFNADSGNFEVGACGNSLYRANVPSSALAQNATFAWSLVDSSGTDALLASGTTTDAEVLYLPYGVLTPTNEVFALTVVVTTAFFSTTSTMNLVRLDAQNIGVKILDPDVVSPSNPNTTLTIQADIGVPGCLSTDFSIDSEDITYIWVYKGSESYTFSHLNTTVDENIVGPTLLGREFKIPQDFMEYGTYDLSLTAFYTNNRSISGSDSTTVRIQPAPLVARINAGQQESFVSQSASVAMTAANSRDPDVLTGDKSSGLSYTWECRYAWDLAMTDALVCGDDLLSDRSATAFTISGEALGSVRNTTKVYIQYSLVAGKTSQSAAGDIARVSEKVFQTLVLSEREDVNYEPIERIDVYDNLTVQADPARVKYFQEVIVAPVASSEDTTWSFELLEPKSASTLLQIADNLISYPGYWSVGATAGTTSLGLKANVLEPSTDYKFLIRSSRPGFEENEEVLELTTVAQPTVTISGLPISSGTTNDTYVISAFTNYNGDFKFFFTLTDEFGFSSCVDGCQGPSIVRFRLLSAGAYQIKCDVYDSLGHTLLASATGGTNITVVSELGDGNSLAIFENQIETTFIAGDHADFQQLGVDMVKYILGEGGAQSPAEDSETLANFTANFNQIVANAVPNAEQSAGYIKTASALSLLTADYNVTFSAETLYYLVNITVNAVTRTPDTIALRQLEDLLVFYGTTPELVLLAGASGTSRRRLLQVDEQDPSSQVNILMADMYEVMKSLIGVVALKPQSCGYIEEIKTADPATTSLRRSARMIWNSRQESDAEDGAKTAAALFQNPRDTALGGSQWTVAHICNPEQGQELRVKIGESDDTSRFGWCPELFEDRFKSLYFMLVHTPNYAYISRIRANTTLSDGLYTIAIGEITDNNTFTDAALALDNCYTVDIPIPRSVTIPSEDSDGLEEEAAAAQAPSACQLSPEKRWDEDPEDVSRLYEGSFFPDSNLTLTDSSVNNSGSIASFTTKSMGVYTVATRFAFFGNGWRLDGYDLDAIEISSVTLSLLILIAVAAVGAWLVGTKLATYVGSPIAVGDADFTYVERDVYGRGTAIDMMDAQDAGPLFA